jgi:DNA-binding LytR/AlgR family response regulator
MIRALVVDDERPAREELAWLLSQIEGVDVVGAVGTAEEALQRLDEERSIQVVFLDIDMPGMGGMGLAQRLGENAPVVIFVTAYGHHAVEAFGVNALDYILKPVRLERLEKAIRRLRQVLSAAEQAKKDKGLQELKLLSRVSVHENGVYRVLPVRDILFFESEDGVVVAQTAGKRYLTDFNLKFLERRLDGELFFRCHRSYIVQLDFIESIVPWGAGTYRLIVNRSLELGVPLSRSRAAVLKQLIPWSTGSKEK